MVLSSKLTATKKTALLLLLVSLTTSCILKIQLGKAAPQTIIVPDDYATIAVAIENATDGDTIFVKKGIYEEETLEISKSLSIIGQEARHTVLNLHPPLVTTTILTQTFTSYSNPIDIEADDVKLSGLTINSEGGDWE
jgi:pectin methylesterase-like acyl-CoA thioesterase